MKKFLANLVLFLAVLLNAVVLIPFNNPAQWGLNFPILTTYEIYIKAGVAGLMFLFALAFLIISIRDQYNYGEVKPSVAQAAIVPLWLFGVSMLAFATLLLYFIWRDDKTTPNLIVLAGAGAGLVNALGIIHLVGGNFRTGGALKKIALFFFTLEILGIGGYAAYLTLLKTDNYASLYTYNYVVAIAAYLVFYVLHLIFQAVRRKHEAAADDSNPEPETKEVRHSVEKSQPQAAPAMPQGKGKKNARGIVSKPIQGKGVILGNSEVITTSEQNVDPTSMLFEDVVVDPEFNKTANLDKQVSSIEYYIEKPKMFKPLDPTFDQLVSYVRDLPNVVTKLADERITFYVDRKPFLVLMNFGNYYRMAFRSELERGIRMIIKYPTISKNKGTKDTLWFKANNYGDLPKEVIYDIVKSAFDNVHA